MKRGGADWLAWTMHAIFGAVVGAVFGAAGPFFLSGRRRQMVVIPEDAMLMFVIGCGLLGSGLGSRFGDALWLSNTSRMLGSDEPKSSVSSRTVSWTLVSLGGLLVGYALFKVAVLRGIPFA